MMFQVACCFLLSVVLVTICVLIWYVYYRHCFTYWTKKGVPNPVPTFPTGNITGPIFGRRNLFTTIETIYKEFKDQGHKHVGLYFLNGPVYLPIDPEIIKSILTTDFEYFVDRGTFISDSFPLSGHLFSMEGLEWKNLRKNLTPVFSSGKMKSFYYMFINHTRKLIQVLDQPAETNSEINIKTFTKNFTADIISSAAFGVEAQTQDHPNNELSENLTKIFTPSWWLCLKAVFVEGFQNPGKLLRPMASDKSVEMFFSRQIKNIIKIRENSLRNDFISVLLQIREKFGMSFNQILAQCYLFYLAGYDTSSQTISYCIHELAHNQNLQDKCRQEIFTHLGKNFEEFSYNGVLTMPYLDKVVNETMRLYPVLGILNRICVKPYKIPGTDIILEKGTPVIISTLGLQRDPDYYPEPLKFCPDRFDDTASLVPFTFLPFGEGPRFCIGKRFGILQTKLGIAALLSQYRFSPSSKTPQVIEFDQLTRSPSMSPREGVKVTISKL